MCGCLGVGCVCFVPVRLRVCCVNVVCELCVLRVLRVGVCVSVCLCVCVCVMCVSVCVVFVFSECVTITHLHPHT